MIIGITGKSGSGKSTLARKIMETNNNIVYLEMDKVGHNALNNPKVIEEVIKIFGEEVIKENKVDRKKLGEIVFDNRKEMDKLTDITWEYMKVEINKFIKDNKDKVIILDWLLLPLTHYFDMCDIKILLDIPYNIRKERAMKRDNITEEEFNLREKASIDFNKNDFTDVIKDDEGINKIVGLIKAENTVSTFINKMGYLENEHVLGCFLYGSYTTGYSTKNSDIDVLVVFDNDDKKHLIRGNEYVNGLRIEYFEKPINDLYLSLENDFNNQCNALLSIVGTSKIIYDKGGLLELRERVLEKYIEPLPKLDEEEAKEYVSILNNRMEKVQDAFNKKNPYFNLLYYVTIEKIRKFYHKLNGLPTVPTSKVYRVYTDEKYRKSFYKDDIPEEEFVKLFLKAACTECSNEEKYELICELYEYAKRNVRLDEKDYRILIKSRNEVNIRK